MGTTYLDLMSLISVFTAMQNEWTMKVVVQFGRVVRRFLLLHTNVMITGYEKNFYYQLSEVVGEQTQARIWLELFQRYGDTSMNNFFIVWTYSVSYSWKLWRWSWSIEQCCCHHSVSYNKSLFSLFTGYYLSNHFEGRRKAKLWGLCLFFFTAPQWSGHRSPVMPFIVEYTSLLRSALIFWSNLISTSSNWQLRRLLKSQVPW